LQQLKKLNTLINQKIRELDDLRIMSTSISSIDYSKDRVQTSPSGEAPFVKIINKMQTLNEEINVEIDKFVDKKHIIINQIQELHNPLYIDLLFKVYVEFKRYEVVAVEMNYTIRNIYIIHGKALQAFQNKHGELLEK
jgi:hypothetical protein